MYTCIFRSTVKNIYWSTVKTLKFIIRYSEYEYESKFSKLMSTAIVRFFTDACLQLWLYVQPTNFS